MKETGIPIFIQYHCWFLFSLYHMCCKLTRNMKMNLILLKPIHFRASLNTRNIWRWPSYELIFIEQHIDFTDLCFLMKNTDLIFLDYKSIQYHQLLWFLIQYLLFQPISDCNWAELNYEIDWNTNIHSILLMLVPFLFIICVANWQKICRWTKF